jgi:flagellar basal-body rod protein FlgF
MATGNAMDVALNDQSVLGVSAPNGELAFTRRGDLRLNSAGVLENGAGHLVKSQGGGNITIPPGFMVSISDSGAIFATDPAQAGVAQPVLVATMLLRDASKSPLERREDGLFQKVGKPGEDVQNGTVLPTLTARSLEGSNVNPIEVMVKLLEQSRSFEQQVNIIKQSKDADEAGASMMKGA